ncbi:regulator of chromosome condensation 1/beta-lactamase-inhibitor protein II, partial [Lentinula raphanica]
FLPIAAPLPIARPGLQLFTWGTNNNGLLGLGVDAAEYARPKLHLWAKNQMSEGGFGPEPGAGLVSVAAGGMHTLLLDEKGTVWSAGVNDDAALGRITESVPDANNADSYLDEDELSSHFHPVQALIDEGFRAVQIAAGDNVGAAVSDQGDLRVWGTFRDHQGHNLFANKKSRQELPVSILQFTRRVGGLIEKVSSIACGDNHILVLTTHGNIYAWGMSDDGRLGRKVLSRHKVDATVPQRVVLGRRLRRAVYVSAGQDTSFAIDDTGDVWAWGLNSMGHTGTGYPSKSNDLCVDQPAKVIGLSPAELGNVDRVVSIAGGEHHTLFLTSQGRVFSCGRCDDGQLGLPGDHEALAGADGGREQGYIVEPVVVDFPGGTVNDPIVKIAAGPRYNMAITQEGVLFSWGFGSQGELGLGSGQELRLVSVPTKVTRREGPWSVREVSCGGQHVAGLFQKRN